MAKTLWIDSLVDQQVSSGGRSSPSLMFGVTETESRLAGMTLMRTIIGVDIAYLVHDAGEGSQDVAIGIGIASQEAFVVAASAGLPDVGIAGDFPPRGWIWRARYRTYGFAADQAAVFNQRVDKDVRSRRKLDNGECYLTVKNTPDQGTASTINVIGLIRQLWLIT